MNMNKILAVLVIGIAVVGLTGPAAAWDFDDYGSSITSNTDITGTHFSSVSQTRVSNIPTTESYQSTIIAEFTYPIFPQYDFSVYDYTISGSDYSTARSTSTSQTGSETAVTVGAPSNVEGSLTYWNCALYGMGIGAREAIFPQSEVTEADTWGWETQHLAGSTYPAHLTESYGIYWP